MDIEKLKSEGHFFAAGALAFATEQTDAYGCHYGMRSDRDAAIAEFKRGFAAAAADAKAHKR